MRGITKAVLAAVICAAAAQASFIYVEVPDPYTKQDYIDAVKGRRPAEDLLRVMKEDAYAQMRERNVPYADYIIFATKDGEVIRPDAEEARDKGVVPRDGPSGEIMYLRGKNWQDWQWAQVQEHLWRAYPVIKLFYGNAFYSIDVHVDLDTQSLNCYYDASRNVIGMDTWYWGYQTHLTHEMVHSFHDCSSIDWDHFEEGFATAVQVAVQNYLFADEPPAVEMWHHFAPGPPELYLDFYYEYHRNQNVPGIDTRLEDFTTPPGFHGGKLAYFRYKAAGFAWWKVFLAERNFFVDFNREYYDRFCDLDSYDYCFHDLQEIAIQSHPGSELEGIPFETWLYSQPILNLPSENQTVMFLTLRDEKFQLWLYERGEDYEWPLANESISFELNTVPDPQVIRWTDHTNDWGYICGDLRASISRRGILDHRVVLSAYEPKRQISRVAFDFYNSTHTGATLPDTELFGVTTGVVSGSVCLRSLDTGELWSRAVSNGAFHFDRFPDYPDGREIGDGRYRLVLLDDGGQLLKTIHFNKDAAEYFVTVNDLGDDAESSAVGEGFGAAEKAVFAVAQNAPNPCSTTTTVAVTLPTAEYVEVVVYDLAGRRVSVPFAGFLPQGDNALAVDTSTFAPGVYVYRVKAGPNVATKKMVVTR